jgi:tRNA(Ile)-lysidine synthase
VHVEHGLHPDSGAWAARCVERAASLGLACTVERVGVQAARGESLEAAARDARDAALARALEPGEVLLTAHQADDQLETVLLALMRGSGVAGLAAMPARSAFARGWHLRPLLAFPRAALERHARAHGIESSEDPSNLDQRFARNYLRGEIVPRLARRWPAAALTAARAAALCGEASELADALAAVDLAASERAGRLDARVLRGLSAARARNALRAWIGRAGFGPPSRARLERVLNDVVLARRDAQPCVAWPGVELRRHGDWVHLMAPLPPVPQAPIALAPGRVVDLGALGELAFEECRGAGLSAASIEGRALTLAFRRGGERIRPAGDAHTRELKKLMQSEDVLPWMRGRIPLLHADGRLAAVADLWTEHEFAARGDERAWRVRWSRHPDVR